MKVFSPGQMREMDQKAASCYHIPSLLLMEQAAYQVFSYIKEHFEGKSILILCGPGNNGGDGLALARQLFTWSRCDVKVRILAGFEKLTEDGRIYYEICNSLQVDLLQLNEQNKEEVLGEINSAHVVVDALFGTGLTRKVEGIYQEVIEAVNSSKAHTVSVDIPSGIDGLTGRVMGTAVKADVTITFAAPKVGLCLYPGFLNAGKLMIGNIGMPQELIEKMPASIYTIEKEEMKTLLPQRPARSNKGTFGKVLIIGGQLGMAGAVSLTSMAAYKAGCGTVTAAVPGSILEIVQQKLTEVMAVGMPDISGHFSEEAADRLKEIINHYDIIAIGPGMGRNDENLELLKEVLRSDKPCIIDADALYFLPQVLEIAKRRKVPAVITPHPGEMARLTGKAVDEILDNPLECAQDFATKFNLITVLKIEKTVIADTSGVIYINRYGNSGLAKGGSGDALTGIITGLMAQHLEAIDAAKLGVYLQTRGADFAKEVLSEYGFLASDTIRFLSKAFLELLE